MPNDMVGFRLCASWRQTNGEAFYCIREYPSSSAPCANEAKDLFCRRQRGIFRSEGKQVNGVFTRPTAKSHYCKSGLR
jgi:hypothetical protein